jgi:hypothetical protein
MPAGDKNVMRRPPYEDLPARLGNLVMAFNELEIALGGALMRILRNKDEFVGAVFVSVLGFRQKYDLLKALAAKIENKGLKGEFLVALDSARAISEERNRYIHAGYTTIMRDQDTIEVVVHQRLRDFSKENLDDATVETFKYIKPIDTEQVTELSNDASALAFSILQLSERF